MIVRAVALKDASQTGTSCACTNAGVTNPGYVEAGTVKDLGGRACDVVVRAGLQLLSCTAAGIRNWLQANSSSGFTALNAGVDVVAFTLRACRDSQFQKIPWNCASATSTQRGFYRFVWSQTCAQENKWVGAASVGE